MSERPARPAVPHHKEGIAPPPTLPPPPPTTITLVSSDGVAFTAVPAGAALACRVLIPALESGATTIPIPGVPARPLALALDFLTAQAALAAELDARTRRRRGTDDPAAAHAAWATAWVGSLPPTDVVSLAAAASYLDAPPLLDLAVASLASRLRRAAPPASLRASFGLADDLSAAEAAAVQADCAGALDAAGW
jgi:hypothetical protein